MNGLTNNYTRAQLNNLPKKRAKVQKLIERLKAELAGEKRTDVVRGLQMDISRRLAYTTKA